MDKKYELVWRNPQKTVLMINYLAPVTWSDVTEAGADAMEAIKDLPQDVILFHNGGTHTVNLTKITSIHDLLYNNLSNPPRNLKFVIVYLENIKILKELDAAMEILDKLFFKRKIFHVASSMAEAERLIVRAGF